MPNYGLLSGLGSGALAGFNSYYQGKKEAEDSAIKNKYLQAQLANENMQTDENGNIALSPEAQAARQNKFKLESGQAQNQLGLLPQEAQYQQAKLGAETAGAQRTQNLYNPESQESKTQTGLFKNIVGGLNPKLSQAIPEGATGADVADLTPKLGTAAIGSDAKMQGLMMSGQARMGRNALAANAQYTGTVGKVENQLNGASRANAIIQGISAKDLQATPQIASDLSAQLATMMSGKPATVYGMSHQDFDSAYKRMGQAYGFLTGQTPGVMTDAQLGQLKKDIGALNKEYLLQHQRTFESWSSGLDALPEEVQNSMQNRYNKFRSSIQQPEQGGLVGQPQNTTTTDGTKWKKVTGGWEAVTQ